MQAYSAQLAAADCNDSRCEHSPSWNTAASWNKLARSPWHGRGWSAGVGGGSDKQSTLVLAGLAGLVGGALSMAVGEFISVSSQRDAEKADIQREIAEQAKGALCILASGCIAGWLPFSRPQGALAGAAMLRLAFHLCMLCAGADTAVVVSSAAACPKLLLKMCCSAFNSTLPEASIWLRTANLITPQLLKAPVKRHREWYAHAASRLA